MSIKKYSLFTITIPLAIIVGIGFLYWGSKIEKHSEGKNQLPEKTDVAVAKENPSFNEVVAVGCCVEGKNCYSKENKYNSYLGKRVQWKAMVSDYAHTSGIRFIVIDEDHQLESYPNRGHFYGTFLASGDDPTVTEEWYDKWKMSYVKYIMDVYGNIQDEDRDENTMFLVTAFIENIDCDKSYDGGYIETSVEKIEEIESKTEEDSSVKKADQDSTVELAPSEEVKYGGEVLQIGGIGSMIYQKVAYNVGGQTARYFASGENNDWINVTLN